MKNMTDKEKIKLIKKILDNNGNDYWDDCGIMCDQIQSIVNEQTSEWNKTLNISEGER
tara:strand:- start:618 stop:791 length:174 start_codon:yes stop_codon:yes gene_type:complete